MPGRRRARFARPARFARFARRARRARRALLAGGGIAVIDEARDGGAIALLDARGAIVARRHVPLCKP